MIDIQSSVNNIGTFKTPSSEEEYKYEPMFWQSSVEYALENGGSLTKEFITKALEALQVAGVFNNEPPPMVFDSRVHMLMPTWSPAIAGWHHDDVPRSLPNGQPNYFTPEYDSKHVLGLVNAEICPTEWATGTSRFPLYTEDVYKNYNRDVERKLEAGELLSLKSKSGVIYQFNSYTWHRATLAKKSGWRWFGRLSWDTPLADNPRNEIRKQVQVYLTEPDKGW